MKQKPILALNKKKKKHKSASVKRTTGLQTLTFACRHKVGEEIARCNHSLTHSLARANPSRAPELTQGPSPHGPLAYRWYASIAANIPTMRMTEFLVVPNKD